VEGANASGKITYMTGFFDGMGLGHNFAYWNKVNDKVCAPKIVGSYDFYSDVRRAFDVDLTGPDYFFSPRGQIQLEPKDAMKARGLDSPDIGDWLAT
jgi:hypothetical protein